jgi:RimJ/RimL family protein N-acetyltransferase
VLDLPDAIETERLRLRRHRPADAAAIAALLDDWAVVRWLSEVPFPYTVRDADEWILQAGRAWITGRDYQFVVTRAEDGAPIGHMGLTISTNGRVGELGYWFGRAFWKRGYATEAAQAVLAFGFLDLKLERIQAGYHPDNRASGRVLVKAGLMTDGIKPILFRALGVTVQCPLFALARHDYLKIHAA